VVSSSEQALVCIG
jgi:periodic tryptophan protein 2